ncbi:MAG: D-glycero-beta-D-manno-heptose 1,7-bisphosphate 7-phosphatase [Planctomycetota bacterium]|jgi:D,D-heptose 1,7-bisphosphate phosphatase
MSDKAIFLDRDGTIIDDPGYLSHPEQVNLLDGAAEALVELRAMGYKLVIVSNQSGIARGILSEEDLEGIHDRLRQLLTEKGAYLDQIYYCPYHPDGVVSKYRKESDWRKPNPGMLLAAADEMGIDLSQSWSIGDSSRDVEAGLRAGCKTILISRYTRNKSSYVEPDNPKPDYKSVNMKEAVNIIKQYHRSSNGVKAKTQPEPETESQPEPETESKRGRGAKSKSAPKSKTKPKKQKKKKKKLKRKSFLKSEPKPVPEPESEPVPEAESQPTPEPESKPAPEAESQPTPEPESMPVPEPESKPDVEPESKPIPETESKPAQESKIKLALKTIKQQKWLQPKPVEQEEAPVGTDQMLKSILGQLKNMQRSDMFSEFSFSRLIAGTLQIIVPFCLLVAVWLLMKPARDDNLILISLGFAVVLQMMSLTFYIMQGRK